jgi:hypothetical protein
VKNQRVSRNKHRSSAMSAAERQMRADLRWAVAHHDELERQYGGESIAVWHKQVIAHGTDEEELLRRAASAERPREQLIVLEFPIFFESPR